jgi:hypothetical protein
LLLPRFERLRPAIVGHSLAAQARVLPGVRLVIEELRVPERARAAALGIEITDTIRLDIGRFLEKKLNRKMIPAPDHEAHDSPLDLAASGSRFS